MPRSGTGAPRTASCTPASPPTSASLTSSRARSRGGPTTRPCAPSAPRSPTLRAVSTWRETLDQFPFDVRYKPGKDMHVDGLTRHSANDDSVGETEPILESWRFDATPAAPTVSGCFGCQWSRGPPLAGAAPRGHGRGGTEGPAHAATGGPARVGWGMGLAGSLGGAGAGGGGAWPGGFFAGECGCV